MTSGTAGLQSAAVSTGLSVARSPTLSAGATISAVSTSAIGRGRAAVHTFAPCTTRYINRAIDQTYGWGGKIYCAAIAP